MGAAKLGGEINGAPFPGLQGEQDGQPGGIAQGAEKLGGLVRGVAGSRLMGMRSR